MGRCWFLMVMPERRNLKFSGSWTMLGSWRGNGEREKDGHGVLAVLTFTLTVLGAFFYALLSICDLQYG